MRLIHPEDIEVGDKVIPRRGKYRGQLLDVLAVDLPLIVCEPALEDLYGEPNIIVDAFEEGLLADPSRAFLYNSVNDYMRDEMGPDWVEKPWLDSDDDQRP